MKADKDKPFAKNLEGNEPIKYDMTKKEDRLRWFNEMEGYLKTSRFVEDGTDFKGRKFAIEAFEQFKFIDIDTRQQTRKDTLKEAQRIVLDYMGGFKHNKIQFVEDRLKCGICKIGDDICKRLKKEVQKK